MASTQKAILKFLTTRGFNVAPYSDFCGYSDEGRGVWIKEALTPKAERELMLELAWDSETEPLNKALCKKGWFTEPHDAGTLMVFMIG